MSAPKRGRVVRRLVVPIVLALAVTLSPYVRRGVPRRPEPLVAVVGSRDRTLPGKARRRLRRQMRREAS